eukprot:7172798-Pyramimonas_sp.AAC.1
MTVEFGFQESERAACFLRVEGAAPAHAVLSQAPCVPSQWLACASRGSPPARAGALADES